MLSFYNNNNDVDDDDDDDDDNNSNNDNNVSIYNNHLDHLVVQLQVCDLNFL